MNSKYYYLFWTLIENRDQKETVNHKNNKNENDYNNFEEFFIPYQKKSIKPRETILK